MNDTERIDWLEQQGGFALISDDDGHWAVTCTDMQNVPSGDEPVDIMTSLFVEAGEWFPSIREAIDAAVVEEAKDD